MLERGANDQTLFENKICGVMFLKKFKNVFYLTHAKIVGPAMFLEVTKRSNILLDKQISNVGPTMFDRSARALFIAYSNHLGVNLE